MKSQVVVCALFLVAVLSGCGTATDKSVAIPESLIEKTQADIARQLAIYQVYAAKARQSETQQQVDPKAFWCGAGNIDFEVSSVKVDLLTTVDDTTSASLSISPPLPKGTAIVPKFGGSGENINTQELTYTLYLLPDEYMPKGTVGSLDSSEIAKVILSERKALRNSALRKLHPETQGCIADFNPQKPIDANGQLQLAIKAISDGNGGVTFSLGILNANLGNDLKRTTGSTMTINFVQTGLAEGSFIEPCDEDERTPCVNTPVPKIFPQPTPPKDTTPEGPAISPVEKTASLHPVDAVVTAGAAKASDIVAATKPKKCVMMTRPNVWVRAECPGSQVATGVVGGGGGGGGDSGHIITGDGGVKCKKGGFRTGLYKVDPCPPGYSVYKDH